MGMQHGTDRRVVPIQLAVQQGFVRSLARRIDRRAVEARDQEVFRLQFALVAAAGGDQHALGVEPRGEVAAGRRHPSKSEEHTSELQSLMRNSYAVFCLKKKT